MAAGGPKIFGMDELYVKVAAAILALVAAFICWKRFNQPRGFGILVKLVHYNVTICYRILKSPFVHSHF